MERIEKLVFNCVFFLLCLLTVILIFERYIEIPFWLQPLGRMHPLVLHFPVVLVVLLVLANIFRKQLDPASFEKVNKFLLWLTIITTVFVTIMGLFLSQEGYSSDLLLWHKWWGVIGSFILSFLMVVYKWPKIYRVFLYGGFVCILVAGHMGAGITHGSNFLLEPITNRIETKTDETAPIFTRVVQPILKKKCQNCHNPQKRKGKLDLSTLENIHKGGENGPCD